MVRVADAAGDQSAFLENRIRTNIRSRVETHIQELNERSISGVDRRKEATRETPVVGGASTWALASGDSDRAI
jgi:hypothetical protein